MGSHAHPPLHILLVEQDNEIRDLYEALFSAEGYVVHAATCARAALALAHSAPDAIFSSLVFPDMSGFDLCRHLRTLPDTAHSLIVALTGYSETGIEQQVREAGFDAYLLKPVGVQTLLALVAAHARRQAVPDDAQALAKA